MPAEEQGAAQQNIVFATGAADPLAAAGDAGRFAAITCGPENAQAFNARLRDELPEFHAFARELHRLGLIDEAFEARIAEDRPDVVFLDELPRNPTGKILKRELS